MLPTGADAVTLAEARRALALLAAELPTRADAVTLAEARRALALLAELPAPML